MTVAGAGLATGGLSRAALWLCLWSVAAVILAGRATGWRVPLTSLAIPVLGAVLAISRMPSLLVASLLLVALVLPRWWPTAASGGWSRTMVLAAGAAAAAIAAAVPGRAHGDETIAALVVLGFLAAGGLAPFGWHFVRWLEEVPPGIAALGCGALVPGVVAALVATQPTLVVLHQDGRAGLLLAGFGGITAVAGGLYALGAQDWRSLAIRTVPAEVGLALVGVSGFDARGLAAAALVLAVVVLTRPVLLFIDLLGPRRGAGLVGLAVALVGLAGLPPTLGFSARLLVLSSAFRAHPVVFVMVIGGLLLELGAVARVLRLRLGTPAGDGIPVAGGAAWILAVATSAALVAGGLFPGALLRFGFGLAGQPTG